MSLFQGVVKVRENSVSHARDTGVRYPLNTQQENNRAIFPSTEYEKSLHNEEVVVKYCPTRLLAELEVAMYRPR